MDAVDSKAHAGMNGLAALAPDGPIDTAGTSYGAMPGAIITPMSVWAEIFLTRQFDASIANTIINHPDVLPHVRGAHHNGELDLSGVVADRRNFVFCDDHATGVVMFQQRMPGIFEMHTGIKREGRKSMARGGAQAFYWMFTNTDCAEILTHCPEGNTAAIAGAQLMGMACAWTTERYRFYSTDEKRVSSDVYSMRVERWAFRGWRCARIGEWFLDYLRTELGADRLPDVLQSDDRNLASVLGACVSMVYGGQTAKGISVFNRWALVNGFRPIVLTSLDPLAFDLGGVALNIDKQGKMTCQRLQQSA